MNIAIEEKAITVDELKTKLEEKFPDYEFNQRNKKMLVVKKTKTVGANILVRNKKIMVGGAFPSMGGQMVFSLSLFLLGILIPIIVYLSAFRPAHKKLENEIGAYVKELTAP